MTLADLQALATTLAPPLTVSAFELPEGNGWEVWAENPWDGSTWERVGSAYIEEDALAEAATWLRARKAAA